MTALTARALAQARRTLHAGMRETSGRDQVQVEAAAMPGLVSYRQYASTDGEEVAVVEFESHETAAVWRAAGFGPQARTTSPLARGTSP